MLRRTRGLCTSVPSRPAASVGMAKNPARGAVKPAQKQPGYVETMRATGAIAVSPHVAHAGRSSSLQRHGEFDHDLTRPVALVKLIVVSACD